ncbi:DUF7455 domain-containing protein [Plantactinospora sp. WMMB782]|uniref:DUF7455 domain-containing protein n=1 Tax=Plantactinospora sp. WMMB782 TaxID=3404121 RepID=UPI003B93E82B
MSAALLEIPLSVGQQKCDGACPAPALVRVTKDGQVLDFCGHHYRKNDVDLFAAGWDVLEDVRPIGPDTTTIG